MTLLFSLRLSARQNCRWLCELRPTACTRLLSAAEDVQAEIKRIEKELDTEAKDAANLLNKEVRSAAFQLHPYKNPTIGWRSDVQKLTLDDVKAALPRLLSTSQRHSGNCW
jgi:zinc protease